MTWEIVARVHTREGWKVICVENFSDKIMAESFAETLDTYDFIRHPEVVPTGQRKKNNVR